VEASPAPGSETLPSGAGGRLRDQVAVVVGGGQTPGETIGNGRATAIVFAREQAQVVVVDRDIASARVTRDLITDRGGRAVALEADVTRDEDIASVVEDCRRRYGRIDILHNNVGASLGAGDGPLDSITSATFDAVSAVNLRTMAMTCKQVVPVMRGQRAGVIINISSTAATLDYPNIAYKTAKAGVIALTEYLAIRNAAFGIRVNCLLPGLMDTPMAIENRVGRDGASREDVLAERLARVPLGRAGTGWDTAEAALFLASPQSSFITGVALRVDGGQSLKVG
jgi:NAD(P)-dependent dehydrogenase (short-subunit alcohol dehydrogenase family)